MIIYLNKKPILKDIKPLYSDWSKALGLMFSLKPKNLLFIFKKEIKIQLHMFFVFFPIDVVLLDKNKKIVELKQDFRPWTFFNSKNKAKYVLELKQRTIKNLNLKQSQKLEFKE